MASAGGAVLAGLAAWITARRSRRSLREQQAAPVDRWELVFLTRLADVVNGGLPPGVVVSRTVNELSQLFGSRVCLFWRGRLEYGQGGVPPPLGGPFGVDGDPDWGAEQLLSDRRVAVRTHLRRAVPPWHPNPPDRDWWLVLCPVVSDGRQVALLTIDGDGDYTPDSRSTPVLLLLVRTILAEALTRPVTQYARLRE